MIYVIAADDGFVLEIRTHKLAALAAFRWWKRHMPGVLFLQAEVQAPT